MDAYLFLSVWGHMRHVGSLGFFWKKIKSYGIYIFCGVLFQTDILN